MRERIAVRVAAACACLALAACVGGDAPPAAVVHDGLDALEILDTGVFDSGPEWDRKRAEGEASIRAATTPEEVIGVLDPLAVAAGGAHSSVVPAQDWAEVDEAIPDMVSVSGGVATVKLIPDSEFFSSTDIDAGEEKLHAAATSVAADLADAEYCGVIVDLRDDYGGAVYWRIGALAPLLPDGVVLSWLDRDKHDLSPPSDVTIDGLTYDEDGVRFSVERGEKDITTPVAILVSPYTASAAEMTALALSARPETRVFGRETAGMLTANGVEVYDDFVVVISSWYTKAVDGTVYGYDPIVPDTEVSAGSAGTVAAAWLAGRGCGE